MEFPSCPMLLSGFLMSSVIYWNAYFVVDYLLRRRVPDIYNRLEEDELRKLCPLILLILRVAFGFFFSLPSCVLAASTTPWGVNQPLNTFGQLCVVSQVAGWANELPLIRFYSMELFIHHVLCLLATSNIILSPAIHQIKPLYIYFASLVGDVGPVSVSILRLLGYRLQTSKPMYWISLASTMILIFFRIGCALYTLTQVLTDPYNLADWVWVLSVLLFGGYSIYNAVRNLRRLGLVKVDPDRYKITFFNKYKHSVENMYRALACSASLLSTLFLYAIYLDRPLKTKETYTISFFLGMIALPIGMLGGSIATTIRPINPCISNPWGSLYAPFKVLITGSLVNSAIRYGTHVDSSTLLESMVISVPLFLALSQVAQYYSVKDDAIMSDEKRPVDVSEIKLHRESAIKHAAIFFISLGFLALSGMVPSDTARLAFCASLIIQLRHQRNTPLLASDNLPGTAKNSLDDLVNILQHKVVTISIAIWYIGNKSVSISAIQARVVLALTLLMAVSASRILTASKPCGGMSAPRRTRKFHPITLLYIFFCTLQAMLIWKYVTFEGGDSEVSLGFKNFRLVLSDPWIWASLIQATGAPLFILKGPE
ncbi:hypothetical protein FLONG3_9874 [Fusarium longipes]|uniref:Uncharacterized protein n=1 Tax=Fusarium longipes TaxID=694270 RepID=A0A395RTU0_9HYPO|nr:hypothetical protein FLONG3_9874 [Fusarium longipes]